MPRFFMTALLSTTILPVEVKLYVGAVSSVISATTKSAKDHVIPHFALCHGGPASDKKRSSAKGTRGAQNNKDDSQR